MSSRLRSYYIGFASSIGLTIIAFGLVEAKLLPATLLTITIISLAVIQLVVQLVFFLHIGSGIGARWKVATLAMALIIIMIIVGGSIWIMNNLDYNMKDMTPEEQTIYLRNHEGL